MRKNINKIVAFAIGISVMSGSIMPAFAADNTQNSTNSKVSVQTQANSKTVLTLDEAIKSAISNSETLALDYQKINYQDQTNDTNEDLDDYNNISDNEKDFKDDSRDINLSKLKQQKEFDEDKLTQNVTTKYNDIVTSQMKIDKAAKTLEIKKKLLEDAKFKESLGMITGSSLQSTELEIQNLEITQKSDENALKDSEYSFKALTGEDVTKYSLEQDVKYEPLQIDGSIDDYLDNVIDSYLKYTEELVNLNKDYYNDSDNKVSSSDVADAKTTAEAATVPVRANYDSYEAYETALTKYNSAISAYTSEVSARLTYLSNKLSVDEDQSSLNENKREFKDSLKTYYTNLLTAEDNINYYKKKIELSNKELSDTKAKYDLGIITESDYNTELVSNEDLDLELRSEIINYNTLKEEIQKPWIALSSS